MMAEEESPLLERNGPVASSKSSILKVVGALALAGLGLSAVHYTNGDDIATMSMNSKSAVSVDALSMNINNEYGVLAEHTRDFYQLFDHIVEPQKESTFNVLNGREGDDITYTWSISKMNDDKTYTLIHTESAPSITYTFKDGTNKWYKVELTEEKAGGETKTYYSEKVLSRWVRREIRDLTDKDRNMILDAMEIMYRIDEPTGKQTYGDDFISVGYMTSVHSATQTWCFHWGDQFITSHPAFQLWFEKSLRSINPEISTTWYWDFMIDSATLGGNWPTELILFKDDWFGPLGAKEDMWEVKTGRFKNIKLPRHKPDSGWAETKYNSYGIMGQPCDNSKSTILQRSADFCGLRTEATFSSSEAMISCFDKHDEFRAWDLCIEINIHGELHSYHGGAYDCYSDLAMMTATDPVKYPKKVMDFIGVGAFNFWFKEMTDALGTNGCVTSSDAAFPCNLNDDECAANTNIIDFTDTEAVSDEDLWSYANTPMGFQFGTQLGAGFLEKITDKDTELFALGARMKWSHLPPEEQTAFTRWYMTFGSNPGKTAISSSGAAPAEPLFWVWHSLFDKMFHVLLEAPQYADKYDMTWEATDGDPGGCGAKWEDHFPFKDIFDNAEKDIKFTNKQLFTLLNPSNHHLPYIYDQFKTWGLRDWDPLDRTTSSSSSN